MKNFRTAVLVLALAVVAVACKKEFDTPPERILPVGSVLTIAELKALYTGTRVRFREPKSVFAVVTADETDGNFYKTISGKPNAGKSSLLNKLVGKERAIVSPIPGTTRDATDTKIKVNDLDVTLIDTAGIRKRGKIEHGVEQYSVLRSFKPIERADVASLMIDAMTGITSQDAHIAGFILEQWKSTVVIVNKWDAIEKDSFTMEDYTKKIRIDLNFMDYVPLLFISAKNGQRVETVMPMALRVQEERLARLTTSKINAVIHKAQDAHPHPWQAYYETDRLRFIGRSRDSSAPLAMRESTALSDSEGSILDPIVAIRRRVVLEPEQSGTIDLVLGISDTRELVVGQVEKYQDRHLADRVFDLAWTHSQVVLQQLNASEADSQLYARLASSVIYASLSLRANAEVLIKNRRGQSGLWGYAISGDLPIVLLQIADGANIDLVRQMVQAHAYWRLKGLQVDLVIWNEDHVGYRQQLQDQSWSQDGCP